MTKYQNGLDNGTQGAQMLPANSGTSGTATTQIFGTGVLTYDTAAAITGTKGVLAESASTVAASTCTFPSPTSAGGGGIEFFMPSFSGADFHIGRLVDTGGARLVSFHISNTNRLRLSDATGTSAGIWTSTAALVAGTKYRVEMYAKAGSTSTTATISGAYFAAGSTTPIETFTTNAGAMAVGSPIGGWIWGRITQSAIQPGFDSPVWEDNATGLPGPITVPLDTPVVTLTTKTNPTSNSSTDGKQAVSWPAVTGASSYEAWRSAGAATGQNDFVRIAQGVTSPYEFTGLGQGTYNYGIKAKP